MKSALTAASAGGNSDLHVGNEGSVIHFMTPTALSTFKFFIFSNSVHVKRTNPLLKTA